MKNFIDDVLQDIAKEENKSVAEIKSELNDYAKRRSDSLSSLVQSLPEHDKLTKIEDLILEKKLTPYSATALLIASPVTEIEFNNLVAKIKQYLKQTYNLVIPDYKIVYENSSNINEVAGTFDFYKKTITIPNNLGLIMPVTLAHEFAHAYQAENSKLYKLMNAYITEKRFDEVKELSYGSYYLTEGWATFVSKLYAKDLDKKFGTAVYEMLLEEKNNFTALMFILSQHKVYHAYSYGCQIFENIYKKYGFSKALICATQLTNDIDLELVP